MVGSLTHSQMEHVLQSQLVGRIACHTGERLYVVPVSYVYQDGYIYAHSKEGLKIAIMRKNPGVCFQVDAIEDMTNWRSVIVWGTYEELEREKDQRNALKIIVDRFVPYTTSESVRPAHGFSRAPEVIEKEKRAVVYRIKVIEMTGRFEKTVID